jgi:hypothetical protein
MNHGKFHSGRTVFQGNEGPNGICKYSSEKPLLHIQVTGYAMWRTLDFNSVLSQEDLDTLARAITEEVEMAYERGLEHGREEAVERYDFFVMNERRFKRNHDDPNWDWDDENWQKHDGHGELLEGEDEDGEEDEENEGTDSTDEAAGADPAT